MCLHRWRGLCTLTAEAQAELTDALSVIAVLTSQDYAFRNSADCVHDSSLLSFLFERKVTREVGRFVGKHLKVGLRTQTRQTKRLGPSN